MAEVKKPQAFEVKSDGYFDTYEAYDKNEADVLFAALERRLRIAERAFDNEWFEIAPEAKAEKFAQAERQIDSEKGGS